MPSMASGYSARLIATGLSRPRGIIVDHNDKLLVVEQRQGVRAITWNDEGGNCLSVNSIEDVVNDAQVNKLLRDIIEQITHDNIAESRH